MSEAEKAKRAEKRNTTSTPTGFASSRLPSVIRPMSSMERWVEDTVLPEVHVRSVYAVDWSRRTGLVVSCGGDGAIVVYKEVVDTGSDAEANGDNGAADVVMNGTTAPAGSSDETAPQPYAVHKMKWIVVAVIEGAHDEFEINHVCWAERRDKDKRADGEEVIISTGDEGDVRVWALPDALVERDA